MSSESVTTFEVSLIVVIGLIQMFYFLGAIIKIVRYRKSLPSSTQLKRSVLFIPSASVKNANPQEILEEIDTYRTSPPAENSTHYTELSVIESDGKSNEQLDTVLRSMNSYLLRNGDASINFDLMKDIVDRHSETLEEDINSTVSVPLYLGLMGTISGIIIGLFNMPSLVDSSDKLLSEDVLNDGISLLVGGVKIAMIASLLGLLLTTVLSAIIFKRARTLIDGRQNALYTFIQVELLPIINEGMASTMNSLQRNLFKFNQQFTYNLDRLTGVFESNERVIMAQKSLLDTIDKTKVSEMTRYNVSVLKELQTSVQHFESFNVNLENASQLVGNTNEFMNRTEDFHVIAENIQTTVVNSNYLLEFLSKHFKELEKHGNAVNGAVADVGHTLSDTFNELKEHIRSSSDQVKQFTVEESELLRKALSQGKSNLDNLEHLGTLKDELSQLLNQSNDQGELFLDELKHISEELREVKSVIGARKEGALKRRKNQLLKWWND